VRAVQAFRPLAESTALAADNKRVGNILAKDGAAAAPAVDAALFALDAERTLFTQVSGLATELEPLFARGDYETALAKLACLRPAVDSFFDHVMVNVDDARVRGNRLALLAQLRGLFLRTADIGLLQS
jgi:glycyl-tRNA synthetase beta chain